MTQTKGLVNDQLAAWDRDHLLHPTTHTAQHARGDVPGRIITGGDGVYVTDRDGNRLLDAFAALYCVNAGYGRSEIADAIAKQAHELAYFHSFAGHGNEPAIRLAKMVMDRAPDHMARVYFGLSGSDANETNVKLAWHYNILRGKPEKRHVISRMDAYHGQTYAAGSIGGKPGDRIDLLEFMDNIHHLSSPNIYRYGDGLSEEEFADKLVAEFEEMVADLGGPEQVSAFWAEPVMGSGGVIPPPANYLKRIWEYCRDNDIVYVADEVVTGFGRLGEWFCSEKLFGITPDVIISAKGLTSGYVPLGATIFSDRIFDVIAEPGNERYLPMGFTYGGHPVACAAALKNIEILEDEKILEHVRDIGPYFMEQLNTLRDLPMVGDVRGSHLMVCIEFVRDAETGEPYPDAIDIGHRVSAEADELGLIVRPVENLNIMSPSLVITREEVDFVVATLRKAIPLTYAKAEEDMLEMIS